MVNLPRGQQIEDFYANRGLFQGARVVEILILPSLPGFVLRQGDQAVVLGADGMVVASQCGCHRLV